MKNDFSHWKKQHERQQLGEFSSDSVGQLWLKTKSIVRKDLLPEFLKKFQIALRSSGIAKQFEELFSMLQASPQKSHAWLDEYIKEKNRKIVSSFDSKKLVSELYKLQTFEWGGDHQNSLDKYLVSRYVKAIQSFDELMSKFDTEINRAVQGYVLNSWYNHWSSILIEHLFKSHSSVLPTVGQIKSVDFFINNVPFDLKVTYFPSEYLKMQRKAKGLPVEITFLKAGAKELGISFDKKANPGSIRYEIVEKLKDCNSKRSKEILQTLDQENMEIVQDARENSKNLAKWLYENQGEMRFGSENRIFLILVDTTDFSTSWKLKRNLNLLAPTITSFLDSFGKKPLKDLEIQFKYKGKPDLFSSFADVIFVMK